MYYPQSQVKTNLYTNGNTLVYKSNNNPYMGYYWSTSTGKFYTGKSPQDSPNEELITLVVPSNATNNQSSQKTIFNDINETPSPSLAAYSLLKPTPTSLLLPTYYSPTPTSQDYQTGEFQRYFVKKINELIYTEVSKDTYDKINSHDPTYLWQYYISFILPWFISGDKLTVAQTNSKVVEVTMQRLKLYKFNEYLGNDYIKFYK